MTQENGVQILHSMKNTLKRQKDRQTSRPTIGAKHYLRGWEIGVGVEVGTSLFSELRKQIKNEFT